MQKMKCTIAYDGSNFSGFQIQPNKRTIQGEVEHVLMKMHKGKSIRIYSSGRTDTGVHAMAQVFHFETPLDVHASGWRRAMQTMLPSDIQVHQVERVDIAFHARFDAVEKEYRYFVLNRKQPDVFRRNYVYHSAVNYNIELIQRASHVLVGTHDFTSFSSAKSTVKGSKVRTLSKVQCKQEGELLLFIIRGNGFLQHMVRIIVGALLEIGAGERTVEELERILAQKNREAAGVTIPPQGLYLWEVSYY